MARISTSSSGGLVSIQDTNGNPITSTAGSLNVNISGATPGESILVYNEVTGVAMASTIDVATYTVPGGNTFSLSSVQLSSDSSATIVVEIDTNPAMKGRIYYTDYNINFTFPSGQTLVAGTVITVSATNNSLQTSASFNATIQGVLT